MRSWCAASRPISTPKYEVVLIQLSLARDLGLLADGDKI